MTKPARSEVQILNGQIVELRQQEAELLAILEEVRLTLLGRQLDETSIYVRVVAAIAKASPQAPGLGQEGHDDPTD